MTQSKPMRIRETFAAIAGRESYLFSGAPESAEVGFRGAGIKWLNLRMRPTEGKSEVVKSMKQSSNDTIADSSGDISQSISGLKLDRPNSLFILNQPEFYLSVTSNFKTLTQVTAPLAIIPVGYWYYTLAGCTKYQAQGSKIE